VPASAHNTATPNCSPQTIGIVDWFDGRISSELLGINVTSRRALEHLLCGFTTAYNARPQRVLEGHTPNQTVAEHLEAKPELANVAPHGRAGPYDTTKAHFIAEAAKKVSQPDTAYNARRQRVLDGRTPNQVVTERLQARPRRAEADRPSRPLRYHQGSLHR